MQVAIPLDHIGAAHQPPHVNACGQEPRDGAVHLVVNPADGRAVQEQANADASLRDAR